jgi:hypothetical protein
MVNGERRKLGGDSLGPAFLGLILVLILPGTESPSG